MQIFITILIILLSSIAWGSIWYTIFYLRYKDRKVIKELKTNLHDTQKKLNEKEEELQKIIKEQETLKNYTQELKEKNTEYNSLIAELSNYSHKLKKAWEKAEELAQILSGYDPEITQKINDIINREKTETEEEENNEEKEKKFF